MATSCKGMGADWGTEASSFSHVWIPTSTSGDASYLRILGYECKASSGNRVKCVACRIVVHEAEVETLNAKFACRPSFCESVRKYREFTTIPHHWVQRKQLKVLSKKHSNDSTFNRFNSFFRENVNAVEKLLLPSWAFLEAKRL